MLPKSFRRKNRKCQKVTGEHIAGVISVFSGYLCSSEAVYLVILVFSLLRIGCYREGMICPEFWGNAAEIGFPTFQLEI